MKSWNLALMSFMIELRGSDFISSLNRDGEFADATDSLDFCKVAIRFKSPETMSDLYSFL
jgi:hypothetical protein